MPWELQYVYDPACIGKEIPCLSCRKETSRCTTHKLNPFKNYTAYVASQAKSSLEQSWTPLGKMVPEGFTQSCSSCREVAWEISIKEDDYVTPIAKYYCTQCKEAIEYGESWYKMGRDLKELMKKLKEHKDDDDGWGAAHDKIKSVHSFWEDHKDTIGSASDHADYQKWHGKINSVADAWGHVEEAIHEMGNVTHGFDNSWFG